MCSYRVSIGYGIWITKTAFFKPFSTYLTYLLVTFFFFYFFFLRLCFGIENDLPQHSIVPTSHFGQSLLDLRGRGRLRGSG